MREFRGAMQARGESSFKVGGDQQRKLRILLQAIEQFRRFEGLIAIKKRRVVGNGHEKRADVVFTHGVAQLQIDGAIRIQKLRAGPDHEYLADFFLERKLLESFLGPLFAVAIEVNGPGSLILVFAACGPRQA